MHGTLLEMFCLVCEVCMFKVGDRVKRISTMQPIKYPLMRHGKIFTVQTIYDNGDVTLVECGGKWYCGFFIKVSGRFTVRKVVP